MTKERIVSLINDDGITGYSHTKEWNGTLFIPLTKILHLKWLKIQIWVETVKILGKHKEKVVWHYSWQQYFGYDTETQQTKAKINEGDNIKLKKKNHSHSKGNDQQNEKTSYGVGEHFCQQCDKQGVTVQNTWSAHTTQYKKFKIYNFCTWVCTCVLDLIYEELVQLIMCLKT